MEPVHFILIYFLFGIITFWIFYKVENLENSDSDPLGIVLGTIVLIIGFWPAVVIYLLKLLMLNENITKFLNKPLFKKNKG